jgi:hypothetical protein
MRRLQLEIDALATTLEGVRIEEGRLWTIQDRDRDDLTKANAWSLVYNKMKNITGQLEALRAQRGQLVSGECFFQDLPAAVSSAKTHADGKFTLTIPREGRYGVVARASREQDEEKRSYSWFVWVSLDGQPSKRLVLNDDNVVGAGSPDSALQ